MKYKILEVIYCFIIGAAAEVAAAAVVGVSGISLCGGGVLGAELPGVGESLMVVPLPSISKNCATTRVRQSGSSSNTPFVKAFNTKIHLPCNHYLPCNE